MLELLIKVMDYIETIEMVCGVVTFDGKVYIKDEVSQAIEDLKSISEPIGAKIENVEVM